MSQGVCLFTGPKTETKMVSTLSRGADKGDGGFCEVFSRQHSGRHMFGDVDSPVAMTQAL